MRALTTITILAALGLAALLISGCSEDRIVTSPVTGNPYPAAVTPDLLMENFVLAYAERAIDLYRVLLDDEFVFTLLPCDVAELGLKKDHWNRADELTAAERMFSGKPFRRDDGTVVPAITEIAVLEFRQVMPWHPVADSARDGVLKAIYDMKIRFAREGTSDLVVAGPSTFYSVPVADRRGADRYRLLGWIDQSRPCP